MADFVVLRTPYLPADLFASLAAQITSDDGDVDQEKLDRDRAITSSFLDDLFARSDIAEALYLASPSLSDALADWRADPTSKSAARTQRSLLSYFSRMTTRATPFGLFAGWSLGEVGPDLQLKLACSQSYRRRSSLDCGYLDQLGAALQAMPPIAANLRYTPNSSLYEAGGRLRYVRASDRALDLIALTPDEALRKVLLRSAGGGTVRELTEFLQELDRDIDADDARTYVAELIDEQVLVSGLTRNVSGPDPLDTLIERLPAAAPSAVLDTLHEARTTLRELDVAPAGAGIGLIDAIEHTLQSLPAPVDPSRLVRCDLRKLAEVRVTAEVLAEIRRGVDLLARIADPVPGDPLRSFRSQFLLRYGDREVPLCAALDAESGIGFPVSAEYGQLSSGAEPLLDGLRFQPAEPAVTAAFGARDRLLASWLLAAARAGRRELVLGSAEIDELQRVTPQPKPLPESFSAMATILAAGTDAISDGVYRVLLSGVAGPSGANLLGRFCGDADVTGKVRAHLDAEEAARPDAIFAEVVHLPEPRLGNVVSRPVLRRYEIPYLAQSGVGPDHQILASDLRISVRGGRIVLRSARLDREVVPRLTAAHNFSGRGNIAVYRFLCSLQHQDVTPWLSFSLDAFRDATFLPRVSFDRFILSRARWTLTDADIAPVRQGRDIDRFTAMRALREVHAIPRWVGLVEGERLIAVDLANIAFIDLIAAKAQASGGVTFIEMFLGPDDLPVSGPEGAYAHEVVVPMQNAARPRCEPPAKVSRSASSRRRFAPGSEWLFAKLYAGPAGVDTLLRSVAEPVVRDLFRAGAIDEWFFVRYGDPDWHLRLRLHGNAEQLLGEALPALTGHCDKHLRSGLIWRLQTDTYEREVDRYGGPAGIRLAESVFHADSNAALAVLGHRDGEPVQPRWRIALAGADRLMTDLGLGPAQRYKLVSAARTRFARELRVETALRRQLGARYRSERTEIEQALHEPAGPLSAFQERSKALAPVRAQLREAVAPGLMPDWVASVVHMQINRLVQRPTNRKEFVIYELLARYYESERARISDAPTGCCARR